MKMLNPLKNKVSKILSSLFITIFCFQSSAFAAITVGQEQRLGRNFDQWPNTYSDIWLGSNNAGHTFAAWVANPARPPILGSVIRFQPYLNHEPLGDNVVVHEIPFAYIYKSPRGCADNNGNVYLAWHNFRRPFQDLLFMRSTDFGRTWPATEPRQLNSVENSVVEDELENTTTLGCDDQGNVYAMWFHSDGDLYFGNIYATHSADFGETWSQPIRVNSTAARNKRSFGTGRPVFAFGPKGRIYAAWLDKRNPGQQQIYLNYSTDHGATWQAQDFRIDQPYFQLEQMRHVRLSADPIGNVYIAWEEIWGYSTIYLRRSSDGGVTWQNKQSISSRDYFGPQWTRSRSGNSNLAWDVQGSVYGFWRKNVRSSTGDRAVLNFSRDFGATWNQNERVIDPENSLDGGEMCVGGNGWIYLVYGKSLKRSAGHHLFVNVSRDNGATWDCAANPAACRLDNASPSQIANPRDFHLTCDSSGRASVAWFDNRRAGPNSPTGYFNAVQATN